MVSLRPLLKTKEQAVRGMYVDGTRDERPDPVLSGVIYRL